MRKLLSWSPAVALVAVVAIVVMGSSSNAMADDAWLERISNLVSRVEAAVHKLDDQQTIAGAEVPARLEGLDRRISKLEHDNGLAQGNLHLYRGDNETRQLESWTQAAASLGQRAGKVKVTLDAALVDKLRKTREAQILRKMEIEDRNIVSLEEALEPPGAHARGLVEPALQVRLLALLHEPPAADEQGRQEREDRDRKRGETAGHARTPSVDGSPGTLEPAPSIHLRPAGPPGGRAGRGRGEVRGRRRAAPRKRGDPRTRSARGGAGQSPPGSE